MNQYGEIACSALSNGHVADIKMVEHLVEGLEAKLYGDRGYISLHWVMYRLLSLKQCTMIRLTR